MVVDYGVVLEVVVKVMVGVESGNGLVEGVGANA